MLDGVGVHGRQSGVTSADKAKAAAGALRFRGVPSVVHSQVAGPFVSGDGKAIETIVPVNLGSKGWNGASDAATALRTIAGSNADGLAVHITRPLGNTASPANPCKGIDGILLVAPLPAV